MKNILWAVSVVALTMSCGVLAQGQAFPAKPIRILSSGGAGGPNDAQTRGLAQFLGERIGQSVLVENRAGAGGIVAGEACVKSAPDGYTLCTFGSGAISWMPVLTSMPYDPLKDMTGVFHMGFIDSIFGAHPSVPVNDLNDVVALAKAKPGLVTWGSFGLTTSGYFFVQWIKKYRNVDITIVPYKSAIQAQQALVAGEIMVNGYTAGQALPMVKAGKIKALAVNGDGRLPEIPNVRTEEEQGFDLPLVKSWFAMMAPAGLPRDIAVRLNTEMNRITKDAKYADQYVVRLGFRAANMDVDQFNAYLRKMRLDFEAFAKDMGLQKK
ncbi:MAG: Bug family tripartite tricarboxylate transporter substrate binding protein [Burkholderiales bacterium]